ncbi:MAG: tetratricopeptide repeat protein [Chitinophagaceae bacterium]|nr:tetratricopeptide repeat protein [Chitinophagaceae bacterium]MCA6453315.1 tetratricopeptide repeat protein [Chitinophagaceae bacterium]MCA6456684.1 tetratricopeptide repeat protein [Chitinophagaceae bacterium]MCA6459947.1 tetratricopeptide repeat protein [Chitinophagaceae bacterium]MCA6465806.1 tetratricopeptide repeat protein [Chitinophagaceae bacterium]
MVGAGLLLFVLLYSFGKTIPPKQPATEAKQEQHTEHQSIKFEEILAKAKEKISPAQNQRLLKLENSVIRGDVKEQQLHVYHQLARFWKDSARMFEPYAYYTAEAAKLENSEKSLTFAAHLFLDNLMTEGQPAMQNWLASNAKVLLEKALVLNPANDSSRIGIGACYLFGNISDNPMEGILAVREIAQKDPGNIYAQMVLGMGGKRSGQFDKAIERFSIVVQKQPDNLEAIFNLAECYEAKGDKANAVKWYETVKTLVKIPEAQKELDKRITELKK